MRLLLLAILVSCQALSLRAASATLFYGVAQGKRFSQTTTNAPTLLSTQGYSGRAFVYSSATVSASVKKPNSQVANLVNVGDHWEINGLYDSPLGQAGGWPAGTYVLTNANSVDGLKVSSMNLSSDLYPNPIRVSNFVEAQSISALSAFALAWDSQAALGTNLIYVRVEADGVSVFETGPIPGQPNSLNAMANATGVTIPAGKLQEGRDYKCFITAWRLISKDTTTIPGALGETAYTCETSLTLRTRWNIQDVRSYGVEKRVNYLQTGATPVPLASPFEVVSFATGAANDSMTAASFRPAGGAYRNLTAAGADFKYSEIFATQAAMEAAFVGGNYEVRMTTKNNGVRAITNAFAGNLYPDPPQVSNIDEAQFVKPAQPFAFSWTMNDATANDLLQFAINDGTNIIYTTPLVSMAGAMNGSQRTLTLPAGVLAPGKTYTGLLRCCRLTSLDTSTYTGAIGQWAYARVTRFPIQTANGPSAPPTLMPPVKSGSQTQLTFTSVRGEKYTIYSSADLRTSAVAQTLIAPGSSTTTMLPANGLGSEFFRIVAGQ